MNIELSKSTRALQVYGNSLEPSELGRLTCVSKELKDAICIKAAKDYSELAHERFSLCWQTQFKEAIPELKGRLYPARLLPEQKLFDLAKSQLNEYLNQLNPRISFPDIFAQEHTLFELLTLARCNPTFEKINEIILNAFPEIFNLIAIYANNSMNEQEILNAFPEIFDSIANYAKWNEQTSIDDSQSDSMHSACQFLDAMLASDFWADQLLPMIQAGAAKSGANTEFVPKELWLQEIKRVFPPVLRKSVTSFKDNFTISELEKLVQFYNSSLGKSIIEKNNISRVVKQFCNSHPEVEQKWFEILKNSTTESSLIGPSDVHEIIPGLFLGNRRIAGITYRWDEEGKNFIKQFLQERQISDVICLSDVQDPIFPEEFTYKFIRISDSEYANIGIYFDSTFEWIEQVLASGKGILVHCDGGISRSSSIVIAYLMRKNSCSYDEAYQQVLAKRPIIKPNSGFERRLQDFEKRLKSS